MSKRFKKWVSSKKNVQVYKVYLACGQDRNGTSGTPKARSGEPWHTLYWWRTSTARWPRAPWISTTVLSRCHFISKIFQSASHVRVVKKIIKSGKTQWEDTGLILWGMRRTFIGKVWNKGVFKKDKHKQWWERFKIYCIPTTLTHLSSIY